MGAVLLAAWWMLGSLADLSFIYFYNAIISQTAPTSKAEREYRRVQYSVQCGTSTTLYTTSSVTVKTCNASTEKLLSQSSAE